MERSVIESKREGTGTFRRRSNVMGKEQDREVILYEERGLPLTEAGGNMGRWEKENIWRYR